MTYLDATILGIVEGITEYLPISSTGHLILAGHFLKLGESEGLKAFDVVIQFGAILAVLGLYRDQVFKMIKGIFGKDKEGLHLALCLILSCLPVIFIGLPLKDTIQAHLFSVPTVAWALLVGGVAMIGMEFYLGKKEKFVTELTYKAALIIGFFQCLALFPGTSRSMVTIIGAILMGLNRTKAAEYSFLLALPVLGGACLIDSMQSYDVLLRDVGLTNIFIGLVVSCIVAALSIKALVSFLNRFGFTAFGVYRVAVSAFLFFVI